MKFGGALQADGSHIFPVRVYYEDTDFSGNVYHAAYLKFFERARTEFLRAHDVHHQQLFDEEGIAFAVRSMQIDYDRAAHIDDILEATTRVLEMKGSRFILEQILRRGDEVITRARVVAVTMKANGRPTRLPAELRSRFGG
ncbi:tol-pal system-associated acyl-CoA thioesterase [Maritalea mediterranea]|uniref:Tol-pal system-associated acyl-CoA thioesterase n=1 Tax=Maritalea mediterranea TaxID=2909667 RepID=A0ABS9E9X2_9HYPH|nr:tol-pal system-associated acyl-CoA thioesterase [Maritalea mediterranea]